MSNTDVFVSYMIIKRRFLFMMTSYVVYNIPSILFRQNTQFVIGIEKHFSDLVLAAQKVSYTGRPSFLLFEKKSNSF